MKEPYYTTKQAAKISGYSVARISSAITRGQLLAYGQIGRRAWYIRESDLRTWLAQPNRRKPQQSHRVPSTNAQNAVAGLLWALPESKRWTPQARERWLAALDTVLDMTTKVID